MKVLWTTCVCNRDGQTFSIKSYIVNILGSAGKTVSVTTTQLCHCRVKAATENNVNEWMWLCANKTLFIKTGSQPGLSHELQFPKPRCGTLCNPQLAKNKN